MIISRTPYRISFFGGGTDYPAWYRQHGGAVLATSIDKYCYLTARFLPPFFEHKHRIVYSAIENVRHSDEIKHPAVRAVLGWANCHKGLEIHHDGDLPARSLSAGQKRRLALARLLLSGAVLWILDEPVTNLDTAGVDLVEELVREHVGRGGLALAAAHQRLLDGDPILRRLELS